MINSEYTDNTPSHVRHLGGRLTNGQQHLSTEKRGGSPFERKSNRKE